MAAPDGYHETLLALVQAALHSPGLLAPNEFTLARYSLNPKTRNRLLDPDICALEDYLIDHSGLPSGQSNLTMLHTFGDIVRDICRDEHTPLQVGYQQMCWLLEWLNIHHLPSFFGEDPDSPLQMLQMAAAIGLGEWATAYHQIDDGLEHLLTLANSPLWRVRKAAALGLQRMLIGSWDRTLRRYRYQALIANALEWRAMIASWADATPDGLLDPPTRAMDAADLLNAALRYVFNLEPDRRSDDKTAQLIEILNKALAVMVKAAPKYGFNQMKAWACWANGDIKAIISANLAHLEEWAQQAAEVNACLLE